MCLVLDSAVIEARKMLSQFSNEYYVESKDDWKAAKDTVVICFGG